MSLENIFYVLGIIYIVGSLLLLIGVAAVIIYTVYKVHRMKDEIESKIKSELSSTSLKAAAPVIITGVLSLVAKAVGNRVLKRKG